MNILVESPVKVSEEVKDPWDSDEIWQAENESLRNAAVIDALSGMQSSILAMRALLNNTTLDREGRELAEMSIQSIEALMALYLKQRRAFRRHYMAGAEVNGESVTSEGALSLLVQIDATANDVPVAAADHEDAGTAEHSWEDGSIWERENIPARNTRVTKFMSDQQAAILGLVTLLQGKDICKECRELAEAVLAATQEALREYLFQQASFRKRQGGFVTTQHKRSPSARCLPFIQNRTCCLMRGGECTYDMPAAAFLG